MRAGVAPAGRRAADALALLLALALTSAAGRPGAAGAQETTDSAGRAALLPPTLVPADLFAERRTVRAGALVIHHEAEQAVLAGTLAEVTARSLDLPGLPPAVLRDTPFVHLVLAPTSESFARLLGDAVPEWGAGVALPQDNVIILPGYTSRRGAIQNLGPVLRHELAHVALQRYLGDVRVPRWFTEGYATWSAGQLDTNGDWLLRLAFVLGRAPPLDSITLDWPRLQQDARIAYLLSADAVGYLHGLAGRPAFERFLAGWREHGSFDTALGDVYYLRSGQFERLWNSHVRRRYGWLLLLAQSATTWLVITLLLLVLYGLRRRRNRARMAQLRADELPDQPAFWLEQSAPTAGAADGGSEAMQPVEDPSERPGPQQGRPGSDSA